MTSTAVPAAERRRRLRGPLVLLLLVVGVGVAVALTGRTTTGDLDPAATDDGGAKALAVLLRDRGVDVSHVEDAAVVRGAAADTTVFVPHAARLGGTIGELASTQARLVVAEADDRDLEAMGLPVRTDGGIPVARREPACADPRAVRAGVVHLGGRGYDPDTIPTGGRACYPGDGRPSYVALDGPRHVVLLGSARAFSNGRLDDEGNAALGLLLLGQGDRLLWLLPETVPSAAADDERGLWALVPGRVKLALLCLVVVVVLAALWRARRLGPVVEEPLPVVVRSAEAVEGRARLYRAAQARDQAGESLRAGLRERLRPGMGLPPDARPEQLVDAVASRTSRPPGEVGGLLYGPAPTDDRALVRLADDLDALDREVRRP